MAKTNDAVTQDSIATSDPKDVQDAPRSNADQGDTTQTSSGTDEPTLLVAGPTAMQMRDALDVLATGLTDRSNQEVGTPSETFVANDLKDSDSPTGKLPTTIEEAQAMVDHVGNPEELDGFKATTETGRLYYEKMIIRPGTRVAVTQDVYDAADLTKKVTLVEGDIVPDGQGFIPANYISDAQRLRLIAK